MTYRIDWSVDKKKKEKSGKLRTYIENIHTYIYIAN